MISLGITKLVIGIMVFMTTSTRINTMAFTIRPVVLTKPPCTTTTTTTATTTPLLPLYMIDRNTADMIDQEYYRQHHKEEYHQQWMAQHQSQIQSTSSHNHIDNDVVVTVGVRDTYKNNNENENDALLNRRQLLRDEKLARTNPQQYCMDRCIATGYCDVYEDYFDLTPAQVVEFCTDCVMASKDECTIPDAFYDHMNDNDSKPPLPNHGNTFLP